MTDPAGHIGLVLTGPGTTGLVARLINFSMVRFKAIPLSFCNPYAKLDLSTGPAVDPS